MDNAVTPHHPAPHRDRTGGTMLAFALLAPPLAWLAQTSINYAIVIHACYPAAEPFLALAASGPWPLLLGFNIAGIAIATLAAFVSYRSWRETRQEASGGSLRTIEAGAGRTRFIALWATTSSTGFAIALLFSLVAIFGVPPCGYP